MELMNSLELMPTVLSMDVSKEETLLILTGPVVAQCPPLSLLPISPTTQLPVLVIGNLQELLDFLTKFVVSGNLPSRPSLVGMLMVPGNLPWSLPPVISPHQIRTLLVLVVLFGT